MLRRLIEALKGNEITDILMVGFVDMEDGVCKFYPNSDYLYVEINAHYYLKVELNSKAANPLSLLKFSIVDTVSYEYEVDEDMPRAISSIADILLDNSMSLGNSIKEIIFYDLDEQQLACAAMELILVSGQMIFIDPLSWSGINIGGEGKKKIWEDSYLNQERIVKKFP